ncbi:hypothetical protein [Rubrolithibacter danxiaensis]|uniref:hypothetical protein n=1 Tax=Rubrolithibacter danxiaensis TaxID=3390805 RepID=UPI003BF8A950
MLYRTPEQVIYSEERKRGMHAVPGLLEPEIFGFDKSDTATSDFNDYTAKVIEKYFEEFLKVHRPDKFSHLMNYNEGILAILEKID